LEKLRTSFGRAGYHLRLALGEAATVQCATYLVEYLPSDFIFFSTHCGEVTGRRIVERFLDKHGHHHVFCYDQALSICRAPGSELFEVLDFICPISMDDVSWADDQG